MKTFLLVSKNLNCSHIGAWNKEYLENFEDFHDMVHCTEVRHAKPFGSVDGLYFHRELHRDFGKLTAQYYDFVPLVPFEYCAFPSEQIAAVDAHIAKMRYLELSVYVAPLVFYFRFENHSLK